MGEEWSRRTIDRVRDFEATTEYRASGQDRQEQLRDSKTVYQEANFSSQLGFVARGMSAYHAFRTSVESRRKLGQYRFLKPEFEETPLDIALAAFDFQYLSRRTTIIPLAIVAGLAILDFNHKPLGYERVPLDVTDASYTMGLSFNAGTNEEAMFRGWIMPYVYEQSGSYYLSNVIQSGLFSLAHINQTEVPIIQLGLGYYLGWLTERNQWTLGESIFIHTWWDVFAFAIQFSTQKQVQNRLFWLPPIKFSF